MPSYRSPEKESVSYNAKFIRVGINVVVTKPDDLDTVHDGLATKEGIYEEVMRLRSVNPDDVDAGLFTYSGTKEEISLERNSGTLRLPCTHQARMNSVTIFENQSLGLKVVAPTNYRLFK